VGSADYGSVAFCRGLSERIAMLRKSLPTSETAANALQRRAQALHACAEFRAETDVVPEAPSLTLLDDPSVRTPRLNVLEEEYWDIYAGLLA